MSTKNHAAQFSVSKLLSSLMIAGSFVAPAAVLFTGVMPVSAFAKEGGDNSNTSCNGQGNSASPCTGSKGDKGDTGSKGDKGDTGSKGDKIGRAHV